MDFSTIKQIVIPEGIVKKIEDGDGNIIWQKVTGPEWHTLWSGSEYAKIYTTSNNGRWQSSISNTNVLATIPIEAMADGCQLRLTWAYSWGTKPWDREYYKNSGSSSSSVPEKPYVIDTKSLGSKWLLGLAANPRSQRWGDAYLSWNKNTRELKLATDYTTRTEAGNNYSAQFVITKIEAYY